MTPPPGCLLYRCIFHLGAFRTYRCAFVLIAFTGMVLRYIERQRTGRVGFPGPHDPDVACIGRHAGDGDRRRSRRIQGAHQQQQEDRGRTRRQVRRPQACDAPGSSKQDEDRLDHANHHRHQAIGLFKLDMTWQATSRIDLGVLSLDKRQVACDKSH